MFPDPLLSLTLKGIYWSAQHDTPSVHFLDRPDLQADASRKYYNMRASLGHFNGSEVELMSLLDPKENVFSEVQKYLGISK